MLYKDDELSPGKRYIFEFRPTSLIDGIINNWALQADLVKAWGAFATFEDVKVLGTIKIIVSPAYASRAGDWAANIKYTVDARLWGKPSTLVGIDVYGGSILEQAGKALAGAPTAIADSLKTAAWFAIAILVLLLVIQGIGFIRRGGGGGSAR